MQQSEPLPGNVLERMVSLAASQRMSVRWVLLVRQTSKPLSRDHSSRRIEPTSQYFNVQSLLPVTSPFPSVVNTTINKYTCACIPYSHGRINVTGSNIMSVQTKRSRCKTEGRFVSWPISSPSRMFQTRAVSALEVEPETRERLSGEKATKLTILCSEHCSLSFV